MSEFVLDSRLENDSIVVGRFPLSLLLMSRDANYPWFILVPQRAGVTEIFHLNEADRAQLLAESCQLSEALNTLFMPDKINVAALGNMVPQLHLHHIARYKTDAAWPGPIWGAVEAQAYSSSAQVERIEGIVNALAGESFTPL